MRAPGRTRRLHKVGSVLVVLIGAATLAATAGWSAPPAVPAADKAPEPLPRAALLKGLAADPDLRKALAEQVQALGGKPDAVLAGETAAKPGEEVNDLWHQGVTLTPRDSQITRDDRPVGILLVYNVFMHSLKDCLAGNFLPVGTGSGASSYAAAGLYDMPGAPDVEHPWIVEVGFELNGMKGGEVRLLVNHEPVPALRRGDTGLVGFVRLNGGKHFVELTQPPADPQKKTRRFWYTRVLRL